ncbi:uncharacterized protein LOC120334845 isoform X1 [Styela clava]
MNTFGILLLCIIMPIILGVSNAQIPWTAKCVDQYELTFFNDTRKNYKEAKAACESLGGYLAKVDNQKMTYVINATFEIVGSVNSYFIGGNDRATEGDWKWQDGTDVIMRGKTGYQNWKPGQPNNYGGKENCLLIGRNSYQWVDSPCYDQLFYICQSDAISINASSNDKKIVCRLRDSCTDMKVQWYRNFSPVTNMPKQYGIYQQIERNGSILHIENASISDIATYTCKITNAYSGIDYNVPVEGNPSITSVTNSSCNQSLIVTWIPNKNAIGVIHRISARNLTTKKEVYWNSSVPTSITPQHIELIGLEALTEYFVTVEACVSESMCGYEYSDNKTASTSGKSKPVLSATLSTNCSIQWIWNNNEKPETVTGLKVTRYCTTIATRWNIKSPRIDSFNISIPQTFTSVPNRNCTVSIQVIGCAGLSEAVNATGYCIGKPAAPKEIAKPISSDDTTDSNGMRKITVTKPDESNGLLSCLFIIVNDGWSDENTNFRMEDLIKAQSSTTEYIAIALPVYGFTSDKKVINLGDGSKSSCNVTQTIDALSKKRRRRRNVGENAIFVGQNRKLDREKSYSVFVVSTTPCVNDICLLTSPLILLKNKSFEFNIVSFVIGFLIPLIFCVVFALIIYKQMKQIKKLKKNAEAKEHNYETIQEKATSPNDTASQPSYSNVLQETAGYEQALPATTKQTQVESAYETYNI